ncbi:hypothetical protein BN131_2621 [Cronobacter malonaticus 681]|nr:hypothetical protein BN131_2621 [Cronobacter malonaticus 681]
MPHRVTVRFGAVARRVPEEAFFPLRFDGFCDLARRVVAPQVLAVFLARRRRRGVGVYLLDYLVGAVPPVAAFEHQLAARVQHRALRDAPGGVVTGLLREHALAAGNFPVQPVAAVRRQRVCRATVAQLHLQQMTGAVTQRGEFAAIRECCAAEVAECVVLILKFSAVVLLAHQLARGVAGEDQHGVPLRLPLFQQRLTPFGARGAADFQRQRIVAVLGAVLCGFACSQAAQHVIFKRGDQRRVRAARQRMANHLRHLAWRVVAVFRQAARVIPLARQSACGVILKPPAFAVRVHQRRQAAEAVVTQARQMACRVGGAHHLAARVARHLALAQPVVVLPAQQPGAVIFVVRLAAVRPPPGAQTPRRSQRPAVSVAFGVAGAERSPRVVIKPVALVAGAVLVAHQLPALVPPEPVRVVQRVGLLNQVALLVPLKARHAAFRVGE